MDFVWRENKHSYKFRYAHGQKLSNARLHIDGSVTQERALDGAMEDMVMVLLFGGLSENLNLPDDIAQRCSIGTLLGDRGAIERFVRPRYILVSRILEEQRLTHLGKLPRHTLWRSYAYVIDGAGNFERGSALRTICRFSDCTVAFTESEIDLLADFLQSNGGGVSGSLE